MNTPTNPTAARYLTHADFAAMKPGTTLALVGYSSEDVYTWVGIDAEGSYVVTENGYKDAYQGEYFRERMFIVTEPAAAAEVAPVAEYEAPQGTYPVGPYTVEAIGAFPSPAKYDRLAEAALCLAARRKNDPNGVHSVYDADGYVIGRAWLQSGIEIMKAEAERTLAYCAAGL